MVMSYSQKQLGIAGTIGVVALVCGLGATGQAPQPKAAGGNKAGLTKSYFGSDQCYDCHNKTDVSKLKIPPILCRCNEVLIWEKADKHKDAYKNLLGPRGQQMLKLLGIQDVSKEQRCVSCHGIYVPPDQEKLVDKTFKLEEGVSCIACHGAYEEWVSPHSARTPREAEKWRSLSRQTKEEQYGMTDLWDPAKRTRLCASCHIGNAQEGKVVTHDMYAAGHPPLPSIEIATFSDEMPRHWQYLKEKDEKAQRILSYDPAELERVKLVVVGGAVDFQAAMQLLAGQAEMSAQVNDPENRLLDLAQFDCYACHHDLKTRSWRQQRGYPAVPGRPQSRTWPLALLKLGIHHAGQKQAAPELDEKLSRLHSAFASDPFGNLSQIAFAARDLATWSQQLTDKLNSEGTKYSPANVPGLLQDLCDLAAAEIPDYDTARQMAWAFRVIFSEWKPEPTNNAKILEKLQALEEQLKLHLPSGQEQQIMAQLPLALRKISDYDPDQFKQTFDQLARLLPPK